MIVRNVTVRRLGSTVELAADVHFTDPLPASIDPIRGETLDFTQRNLWYRFPTALATRTSHSGDPFLAALLPLAIRISDDELVIEAPVSAALLEACPKTIGILAKGIERQPNLRVAASSREDQPSARSQRNQRRASFFSGGVDSFYTALKHLRSTRGSSPISDLIYVQSDAVQATAPDAAAFASAMFHLRTAAAELGLPVHVVTTNLSEFHNRCGAYGMVRPNARLPSASLAINQTTLGSALWSVALCLQNVIDRIYIPAHYTLATAKELFHVSSPFTDPLWSTNLLQFVHDGTEANRLEKIISSVAKSSIAMEHLNVCWNNVQSRSDTIDKGDSSLGAQSPTRGLRTLNCGHCEKCIRTQFALEIAGVCPSKHIFPDLNIDDCVSRLANRDRPLSRSQVGFYQEMQDHLDRAGGPRRVLSAIHSIIENAILRGMSNQTVN